LRVSRGPLWQSPRPERATAQGRNRCYEHLSILGLVSSQVICFGGMRSSQNNWSLRVRVKSRLLLSRRISPTGDMDREPSPITVGAKFPIWIQTALEQSRIGIRRCRRPRPHTQCSTSFERIINIHTHSISKKLKSSLDTNLQVRS
jgi:hypothetical protein